MALEQRKGGTLLDVRDLVARCLHGDGAAMKQLVSEFRGQVFGLCFRMLGNREDAEDITQESFVRALRSLGTFDTQREFRPWLLAIAGNRCRTMLSARMRRPAPGVLQDEILDTSPDPLAERLLSEEVELALGQLRDEYRRAFLLFHEQELSYAEIAEAMACPLGTVKTWVHRARRELAKQLTERGVVEDMAYAVRGV